MAGRSPRAGRRLRVPRAAGRDVRGPVLALTRESGGDSRDVERAPLRAFRPRVLAIGLAALAFALLLGAGLADGGGSRRTFRTTAALVVLAAFLFASRERNSFPGLERGPLGAWQWWDLFWTLRLSYVLPVLLLIMPLPDLLRAALLVPAIGLIAASIDPPLGQLARGPLRLRAELEAEGRSLSTPAAPPPGLPAWWLGAVLAPSALLVGGVHPEWAGLAPDRHARAALVQRLEARGYDAVALDQFTAEFLDAWDARDREALDQLRHPDAGGWSLFPGSKELPAIRRERFEIDETLLGHPLPVWWIETELGHRRVRIVAGPDGLSWR